MRPVCLSVYINFKISKQNRQEKWSPCWVHCGRVSNCAFFWRVPGCSPQPNGGGKNAKQNVVEIYFKRNFGACALCHCNGCWKMKLLYGLHNWIAINHKRLYHNLWSNVENYSNYSPCSHIFFALSLCVSVYLWVHYLPLCECVFVCVRACVCKWVYCHRPNANRLKTVFFACLSFVSYGLIFKQWKITIKRKKEKNINCNCRHLTFVQVSKQGPTIMNGQQNERAQAQAQASHKRYFWSHFHF